MSNPKPSAQEMVLALERWGLERGPKLRALYAPLREAAAQEAAAQRALTKPRSTRTSPPAAAPARPDTGVPRPAASHGPARPKSQ
jgi:hypothetical protein